MKPQFQSSSELVSFRRENIRPGRAPAFPVTDYQYLGSPSGFTGRAPTAKLSSHARAGFHRLSNEFIGAEMKRDYFAEAAFFAIIVAISAWPIASMFRAMGHLP